MTENKDIIRNQVEKEFDMFYAYENMLIVIEKNSKHLYGVDSKTNQLIALAIKS